MKRALFAVLMTATTASSIHGQDQTRTFDSGLRNANGNKIMFTVPVAPSNVPSAQPNVTEETQSSAETPIAASETAHVGQPTPPPVPPVDGPVEKVSSDQTGGSDAIVSFDGPETVRLFVDLQPVPGGQKPASVENSGVPISEIETVNWITLDEGAEMSDAVITDPVVTDTPPLPSESNPECCGQHIGCGEDFSCEWAIKCGECVPPFTAHRTRTFIDWLYLSARGQDLGYATPVTAAGTPTGSTATVSPNSETGFRLGGAIAANECTSLYVAWSRFRSSGGDVRRAPGAPGGPFLQSTLLHPSAAPFAGDSRFSSAGYDLDFDTADVALDWTLTQTWNSRLNGSLGFRWGSLTQDLRAVHVATGLRSVRTNIDFDGYGPRFGLDYERIGHFGLITYGRGALSLLIGEFDARYRQAVPLAVAGISEDRVVPQLDLECGFGWESHDGAIRLTTGYFFGFWNNVVTTPAFINGVRTGRLADIDDSVTFDGLAFRAEVRF